MFFDKIISPISERNWTGRIDVDSDSEKKLMGSQASKIIRTSKMASSAEIQQFIKDAIAQEKVVVFSKSYCPYCTMAKEVSTFITYLNFYT